MILTGKAKEDFDYWLYENYDKCQIKPQEEIYWQHFSNELTLYDIYEKLPLSLKQQLIIEFFDSVGIYIEIIRNEEYFDYVVMEEWDYGFETRQEATEQAIKKANDIYNNTDKV